MGERRGKQRREQTEISELSSLSQWAPAEEHLSPAHIPLTL